MAEELGLDELRAHALATVGMARNDLDGDGLADMERALEIALAADSPVASAIVNNLGVYSLLVGDWARAEEFYVESSRLAERYGDRSNIRFVTANQLWLDVMRGHWDRGLAGAEAFIAECEAGSPHTNEGGARFARAIVRLGRGDPDGALADKLRELELSRAGGHPHGIASSLSGLAALRARRGELDEARTLAAEVVPAVRELGVTGWLTEFASFVEQLGLRDELAAAIDAAPTAGPRAHWRELVELMLDGDLRGAADTFAEMGTPTREADLRLAAGRRFFEQGLRDEGAAELERALAFYRTVDATAYIAEIEALLGASAQSESA